MVKVKLLNYTPDPDRLVASAARLCYSPVGVETIIENIDPARINKLIEQLRDNGHESPLEHVSFSFGIEGVSRALTHQLVRHRIASYSQQSQRYIKVENFQVITPPTIEKNQQAAQVFNDVVSRIREAYRELLKEGIPAEDARYILPNACETKLVVTMNARSLLHFMEIRTCTRAQWEIRRMALLMKELVREVAPLLFQLAGPTCETRGYCKEGSLGCGKASTLTALATDTQN